MHVQATFASVRAWALYRRWEGKVCLL